MCDIPLRWIGLTHFRLATNLLRKFRNCQQASSPQKRSILLSEFIQSHPRNVNKDLDSLLIQGRFPKTLPVYLSLSNRCSIDRPGAKVTTDVGRITLPCTRHSSKVLSDAACSGRFIRFNTTTGKAPTTPLLHGDA